MSAVSDRKVQQPSVFVAETALSPTPQLGEVVSADLHWALNQPPRIQGIPGVAVDLLGQVGVHLKSTEESVGETTQALKTSAQALAESGSQVGAQATALTKALAGLPREVRAELELAAVELKTAGTAMAKGHDAASLEEAGAALGRARAALSTLGDTNEGEAKTAVKAMGIALDAAEAQLKATHAGVERLTSQVFGVPEQLLPTLRASKAKLKAVLGSSVNGQGVLAGFEQLSRGRTQTDRAIAAKDPFLFSAGVRAQAQGFEQATKAGWRVGREEVSGLVKARTSELGVGAQLSKLGPGERFELDLGLDVHAKVGVEGRSKVTVSHRPDGKWQLNAQVKAGGNVTVGMGRLLTHGSAWGEASAHQLVGASFNMTCATQADAARTVSLLEHIASKEGTFRTLSQEEANFLRAQVSSVELNATTAGQLLGVLNVSKSFAQVQADGRLTASATPSVRLDLKDGHPSGLTVAQTFAGRTGVIGGPGLRWGSPALQAPTGRPMSSGQMGMASIDASVQVEGHLAFPAGVTLKNFVKEPEAVTRAQLAAVAGGLSTAVTLKAHAEDNVSSSSGQSVEAELAMRLSVDALTGSSAVSELLKGDLPAVAESLKSAGAQGLSGGVTQYDLRRFGTPNMNQGVFGVTADITATGARYSNPRVLKTF